MDMMTLSGVMFLTTTANPAETLLGSVGSSLESIVGFFGTVITALLTPEGALVALLPMVGISIGFGIFRGGLNLISRFTPGV